ncbi:TPA: winged helix-turn-helix domain-containing protein [Vibrio cholerae]|uniref:winged helix-turn-helix domain-containing protein n=1 Tax=Vibrio cholerae TaxID=666 RepID=UPI001183B7EC|nr:winged helix-turn-helix domain-containing protein [Vibrio cholerae]TVN40850.1 response regulator transcription factor [Vibrio cholerae]TYW42725.1 response regulator transcription factor [Vibrio cholerae]HDV5285408.1 winged helix-turn-helix domain-containing protein [Vibrio cholerae]HDV5289088.1 winged helix-turn-helix domain-containing protein [Vibrio cholerae]HDV5388659.1 winged helix-turn-helix domain-containing protein [Vibrio cholerae]
MNEAMPEHIHVLLLNDQDYDATEIIETLDLPHIKLDVSVDAAFDLNKLNKKQYDIILIANEEFFAGQQDLLSCIRSYTTTPTLVLVYEYSLQQCELCFSLGGDDYVAGPKHLKELPSRIIAALRRSQRLSVALSRSEMLLGDLYLNRGLSEVRVAERLVVFTPIQFKLLWSLATHYKQVVDKRFLYKTVLNKPWSVHDRSLDMHLSRVRKKLISAGFDGERIATVHGIGYSLSY